VPNAQLTPEMQIFQSRVTTRRVYVIGGVLTLVAGSAVLIGTIAWDFLGASSSADTTFRFIALLIIFMTALATCAAVYGGLRLGNPLEAFGLPTGSIRALLAIGIMILFVVFGLPLVSNDTSGSTREALVLVPKAELTQAIQMHRDQGLTVIVTDYGADPATNPAGQLVPARSARLRIFGNPTPRSPEQMDLAKQLLTAIVTLLTTVVGFYFGSRSTAEIARDAEAATGGAGPTDVAVQRQQIEDKFSPLKASIVSSGQTLSSGGDAPAPGDTAQAAERQTALDRAQATRLSIEAQRDEIATKLAAADEAIAAMASSSTDARAVHERNARDNLRQAAELVQALEAAVPAYVAQVEDFTRANAAG
jgi:hypothetical protein